MYHRLSQFHYGSITTFQSSFPNISPIFFVSIPLWFDYNPRLGVPRLWLDGLVSIPLWFDYNANHRPSSTPAPALSQFHYGSITTLFNEYGVRIKIKESQFHYGSITTKGNGLVIKFPDGSCLNSTMVRLQLFVNIKIKNDTDSMSQFHYGSITTKPWLAASPTLGIGSQFHYGSITTQNLKIKLFYS